MPLFSGTSGADTLTGGASDNVMTGAAGSDVFVYQRASTDTVVTDFGSIYFTATLSGQQEAPPNPSPASGTFSGVLNRARTAFNFTSVVSGIDLAVQTPATADNVAAAHFHAGPPGTAGGVVFGFLGTPNNDLDNVTLANPATGSVASEWRLNEGNATTLTAQIPNLLASNIYINFHTVALPGGEIRGQVIPLDAGADRIDLRDAHIGDLETLGFVLRPLGFSTAISTTLDGRVANLVLQGVPMGSLTASDFIFADATPTSLAGTSGNDHLFGAGGTDTLVGGDGSDRLFGALANDMLDGGGGADTLYGQSGSDLLAGGAGNDSVQGNDGTDTIFGGDGTDQIFGGKGADLILGEAGNDTLSGDLGDDVLSGGAGADRFVFRAGTGRDWASDFNFGEGDRIGLSTGMTYTVGSIQNQVLLTLASGDVIGLTGITPASFTADFVVFG